MNALVETAEGVYTVGLDETAVLDFVAGASLDPAPSVDVELPRVVTAAASGSTVVALVGLKPPLVVSHDAGRTWHESGRGLPAGRAVAIAETNPDLILFAASERLYLSRDGGRFWTPLGLELPGIEAVAFDER